MGPSAAKQKMALQTNAWWLSVFSAVLAAPVGGTLDGSLVHVLVELAPSIDTVEPACKVSVLSNEN